MDKYLDFPEPPRRMTDEEGEQYFLAMKDQIIEFEPTEIVAVNRSGFSYAQWIAQELALPLGAYWPKEQRLILNDVDNDRLVFVDDNILAGTTFLATQEFMRKLPSYHWKWAVLFSDWNTPEQVRNQIIQGVRLPFFAEEPVWGSRKISKDYGVRYRDEKDSV